MSPTTFITFESDEFRVTVKRTNVFYTRIDFYDPDNEDWSEGIVKVLDTPNDLFARVKREICFPFVYHRILGNGHIIDNPSNKTAESEFLKFKK